MGFSNSKNNRSIIIKKNAAKILEKLNEIDIEKDKHKYLCLSCIYGAFLGDSMGSCCEFSPPSKENHTFIFQYTDGIFAPGEVTDDSEMAISAAFAYIDIINEDPSKHQDLLYYYFGLWSRSKPKDIGLATINALKNFKGQNIEKAKFNYQHVKTVNWDSLANGFLMRISTFITYYYFSHLDKIYSTINNYEKNKEINKDLIDLYNDIYIESSKNTEITHPNYENGISSAVFTLLVLFGMVTKDASEVYSLFIKITSSTNFFDYHQKDKQQKLCCESALKKYKGIIDEVESNKISPVDIMIGYYIHGFKLSIYFVKKLADKKILIEDDAYYKIMCDVCDAGGDTDTNCAIVGVMIGPLIGYKNFNDKYFNTLIKFIPKERPEYNSAFMYIYVDYLEKKFLKEDEKKLKGKTDENKEQTIPEKKEKDDKLKKTAFKLIEDFSTKEIDINNL